jgi:hypothetical protein
MKKILLLSLNGLICYALALGQGGSSIRALLDEAAQNNAPYRADNLFAYRASTSDAFGEYSTLLFNSEELTNLLQARPSLLHLRIPKDDGQVFDLELVSVEILRSNPTFYVKNDKGRESTPYEPGLYYRGFIRGNKLGSSLVSFSLFEDGLMGFIADESGSWNLGPERGDLGSQNYVLFNDHSHPLPLAFNCGTSDETVLPSPLKLKEGQSKSASNNCVDIYYECDNDLFLQNGSSVWRTLNYATGLFNITATIFQNENIGVRLSSASVWNTPDGYSENNSNDALNSFIIGVGASFDGDVAQLIAIDTGGHGGLAITIGFTCGSSNNRHCFTDVNGAFSLFPTYSWDADATTHELGHLLGSHHTHWCSWIGGAIDNCYCQGIADGNFPAATNCREPNNAACTAGPIPTVGTIMSYCHGVNGVGKSFVTSNGGGFGTQPANAIIAYIDGQACLGDCNCPANLATTDIPAAVNATAPPQLEKYEASNSIESNSVINTGAFVKFDAGNVIRFTPGFWARSGSTVHAYIEGCGFLDGMDGTGNRSTYSETIKEEEIGLSIFPNPFDGSFSVQFEIPAQALVSLSLSDAYGRQVFQPFSQKSFDAGEHTIQMENLQLPPGIYYLELKTPSARWVQKLVKVNP